MFSRSVAVVLFLVTLTVGAIAADVFQTYKLNREGWAGAFVSALVGAGFSPYEVPRTLRSLAPAERAAVVTAMGAAAKAWVATPAFKTTYKEYYGHQQPEVVNPPRTAKQIADAMRAVNRQSITDLEEELKRAPASDRKRVEENLARQREFVKDIEKDLDQEAKWRADEERDRWDEYKNRQPDPDAPPADSGVALKQGLKKFLSETAGVDYAAALRSESGAMVFVRPAYEEKNSMWKMCFRAGKDACETARTFATGWLAELK